MGVTLGKTKPPELNITFFRHLSQLIYKDEQLMRLWIGQVKACAPE